MQTLCRTLFIRAKRQQSTLALNATHTICLLNAKHGDIEFLQDLLPILLDVHSQAEIEILLTLKGARLQDDAVFSAVQEHFLSTLRKNEEMLGINRISDVCVTRTGHTLKIVFSPQRSKLYARPGQKLQAILKSVHIELRWNKRGSTKNVAIDMEDLECLLNEVFVKFICFHLAKRYPLIFGSWGESLDNEMKFFVVIGFCLVSMSRRSQNEDFRHQVRRQIRSLRRKLSIDDDSILQTQDSELSALTFPGNDDLEVTTVTDALCTLWKRCNRPPIAKCAVPTDSFSKQRIDTQNRTVPYSGSHNSQTEKSHLPDLIAINDWSQASYHNEMDLLLFLNNNKISTGKTSNHSAAENTSLDPEPTCESQKNSPRTEFRRHSDEFDSGSICRLSSDDDEESSSQTLFSGLPEESSTRTAYQGEASWYLSDSDCDVLSDDGDLHLTSGSDFDDDLSGDQDVLNDVIGPAHSRNTTDWTASDAANRGGHYSPYMVGDPKEAADTVLDDDSMDEDCITLLHVDGNLETLGMIETSDSEPEFFAIPNNLCPDHRETKEENSHFYTDDLNLDSDDSICSLNE